MSCEDFLIETCFRPIDTCKGLLRNSDGSSATWIHRSPVEKVSNFGFQSSHRVDAAVEVGEEAEAGLCVLKSSCDPPESGYQCPPVSYCCQSLHHGATKYNITYVILIPWHSLTNGRCRRTEAAQIQGWGTSRAERPAQPWPALEQPKTSQLNWEAQHIVLSKICMCWKFAPRIFVHGWPCQAWS